jgi:2-polyprenyl-6-methoxyphenol hydroxylase-like FAD-dependent oxidoreductase
MHGIVLKRLGHNVHILEQNTQSERADLAAGITTHPPFEEFMGRHDRTRKPWAVHSTDARFLNKNAVVTKVINRPLQMTSWGVIYHRLRANFDSYTSDFCPDAPTPNELDGNANFDGGKRVTSISLVPKDSDGVVLVDVTYEDIKNCNTVGHVQADMVILADGASSRIRNDLFPSSERIYAGYVAFRGTVPEADVSEEAKKIFDPNLTYNTFKNGYILL